MNTLSLKRIDESNFLECFGLELAEGQDRFVSHPIRSLAQAYVYYNQCTPFGIFHEGTMVGYVMVIYDHDEETYNLWHMMIDKKYQGKGYGRAAVALCLDYIRTKPFGSSGVVLLSCHKENGRAMGIYEQYGFAATGECDDDEIMMKLTLWE